MCFCARVCRLPFYIKVEINIFSTVFTVSVLCVCVREVHRLKKFENMVIGGAAVTDCAHREG